MSPPFTCPICRNEESGFNRQSNPLILHCTSCGHFRLNPDYYQIGEIEAHYDDVYAGFRDDLYFSNVISNEIEKEFVPRMPPPARILDVGCGNGEFLAQAQKEGYQVEGIDISEAAAGLCRSKGLDAVSGDFLETEFTRSFSFITLWDVIEHLPKPIAFIQKAFQILKPEGVLVLKTPSPGMNTMRIAQRFPRLRGGLIHFPDHIQFFTKSSLDYALKHAGFTSIQWLPSKNFRSQKKGGGLKKMVYRRGKKALGKICRDQNLYCFARKP